jgi:hypothetical protein
MGERPSGRGLGWDREGQRICCPDPDDSSRRGGACLPLLDYSSRRAGACLPPERGSRLVGQELVSCRPQWRQTSCRPTSRQECDAPATSSVSSGRSWSPANLNGGRHAAARRLPVSRVAEIVGQELVSCLTVNDGWAVNGGRRAPALRRGPVNGGRQAAALRTCPPMNRSRRSPPGSWIPDLARVV